MVWQLCVQLVEQYMGLVVVVMNYCWAWGASYSFWAVKQLVVKLEVSTCYVDCNVVGGWVWVQSIESTDISYQIRSTVKCKGRTQCKRRTWGDEVA